jgi:hypothetical protein
VKGWKCGPANPFGRRLTALRQAVLDVVDEARLRRIVTRMADLAETGDVAAAALIMRYAPGKPAPVVDPDGLDLQELQLLRNGPSIDKGLTGDLGRLALPFAVSLVRLSVIRDESQFVEKLSQLKREIDARLDLIDEGFSPGEVDRMLAGKSAESDRARAWP